MKNKRITNHSDLPFDFSDNYFVSYIQQSIKFHLDFNVIYQVLNKDRKTISIYDYENIMKAVNTQKVDISEIYCVSLRLSIVDNMPLIEELNAISHHMGLKNDINDLFQNIYSDAADIIDSNISTYYDIESVKELFQLDEEDRPETIYDLEKLNDEMEDRIDIIINMLDINKDKIRNLAIKYYEEFYMIAMMSLHFVHRDNGHVQKIVDTKTKKVLGEIINWDLGTTYYFKSGKDFKTFLNKEEKTKMPEETIIKMEPGYEYSISKSGSIMYFKLDENGKKKRISKEEGETHIIKEDVEPEKKVKRGRRVTKEELEQKEQESSEETNNIIKPEISQVDIADIPTENVEEVARESIVTAGDRECYLYFDMKLTENTKNATVISVALTNCDGKTFYAELNDYIKTDKTDLNIIDSLLHPNNTENNETGTWTFVGNMEEVSKKVSEWINTYYSKDKFIQCVTDDSPFKFVMLMDILGYEVNENMSNFCIDLNQDIATSITRLKPEGMDDKEFNNNFVPAIEASHLDRINYVMNSIEDISKYQEQFKNTSLFSVLLIKSIHQFLWNL